MPWFDVSVDGRIRKEDHAFGYVYVSDLDYSIFCFKAQVALNHIIDLTKEYCSRNDCLPSGMLYDRAEIIQLSDLALRTGVWGFDTHMILQLLHSIYTCVEFYNEDGRIIAKYGCCHSDHPPIYDYKLHHHHF